MQVFPILNRTHWVQGVKRSHLTLRLRHDVHERAVLCLRVAACFWGFTFIILRFAALSCSGCDPPIRIIRSSAAAKDSRLSCSGEYGRTPEVSRPRTKADDDGEIQSLKKKFYLRAELYPIR